MGRALARELAARQDTLFLLGRDEEELHRSVRDLNIRAGVEVAVGQARCDLDDPSTHEPSIAQAATTMKGLDAVIITAGRFATQDDIETDPSLAHAIVTTNFANTVCFCEHARAHLMKDGGGTLCVFSSVAGDRGRKPVVVYGASKAGLSAYLEGLDHRYRAEGLKTICVKPGFVKTSMTDGLRPPPFAGEPEDVARTVIRAIDRGAPVVYAPPIWRWVMAVIRRLPRPVMRRIGF